MFELIEQGFSYCGILILVLMGVILCGMIVLVLLVVPIKLSSRKSSIVRQFIAQFVRALIEFLVIVGLGLFFGIAVGAAIKSILYITPAMWNGAFIGFLFSSMYALSRITPKWGHCYLDKHDYGLFDEYTLDNNTWIDACKWCGKHAED